MALDSAAEWKQLGQAWMIDQLKTGTAPATVAGCQQDPNWWAIFAAYASGNLSDESVDFLAGVDEFKRANDLGKAQELYTEFVRTGAPRQVNLYSGNLEALQQIFEGSDDVLGSLDMFDAAAEEVRQTLDQHTYRTFVGVAAKVRDELLAEGAGTGTDATIQVSNPTLVELTRDRIDMAVVDSYNEWALKALEEGFTTNFYQLGDLVIIQGPMPTDEQPYVSWIRSQPGRTTGSSITMTAKGSGLSAGSISVKGASDRDFFKKAIARVSKKKVIFEG